MNFNFIKNKDYLKNISKSNNPNVKWFKYFGIEIWNRLGFAHHNSSKIKYNEVTITQELVYNLFKFIECKNMQKYMVRIFESKNEKTNGADLVFSMVFKDGIIDIPVQAKVLTTFKKKKEKGIYNHLFHKEGSQLKNLIEYGENKALGGSLYLLYNYVIENNASGLNGITFCKTKDVGTLNSKFYSFLHDDNKFAIPIYKLFSDPNNPNGPDDTDNPNGPDKLDSYSDVKAFFKKLNLEVNDEEISKVIITKDRFLHDDTWVSLFDLSQEINTQNSFSPRYRFVFATQSGLKNFQDIFKESYIPGKKKLGEGDSNVKEDRSSKINTKELEEPAYG